MQLALFSTKPYDREFLETANAAAGHQFAFHEARLTDYRRRSRERSRGGLRVVNDLWTRPRWKSFVAARTRLIVLRSAGFNNVDLRASHDLGVAVTRVPALSPNAVAKHAVALMLMRKPLHEVSIEKIA